MNISILCTSEKHPVMHWLKGWRKQYESEHEIALFHDKAQLIGGDLLFLISCSQLIGSEIREKFSKTLVIHAADLPQGRGWSPHIWQILEGKTDIVISLLEAEDKVDSGAIWRKERISIPETALYDEINELLFTAEMRLMSFAVEAFSDIVPQPQDEDIIPTYYRKRSPEDSRLDSQASLSEQFNLLRVCDPDRFPAFFDLGGQRFLVTIRKADSS